jgi:hypothetical protein
MIRTSTFIGLVTALVLVLVQIEAAAARGERGGDGKHVTGGFSRGSGDFNRGRSAGGFNRESSRSSRLNRDNNRARRTNTWPDGDANTSLNRRPRWPSTGQRPIKGHGLGSGIMTNAGQRRPTAGQLSSNGEGTNLGRGLGSGNMTNGGHGAKWRDGDGRPGGGERPHQLPSEDRGYLGDRNFNHYQSEYEGDTVVYVALPPLGEQTPGTTIGPLAAPPTK